MLLFTRAKSFLQNGKQISKLFMSKCTHRKEKKNLWKSFYLCASSKKDCCLHKNAAYLQLWTNAALGNKTHNHSEMWRFCSCLTLHFIMTPQGIEHICKGARGDVLLLFLEECQRRHNDSTRTTHNRKNHCSCRIAHTYTHSKWDGVFPFISWCVVNIKGSELGDRSSSVPNPQGWSKQTEESALVWAFNISTFGLGFSG